MSDTSGAHTLIGLLFPVTAGAAANQNPTGPVDYTVIGVADTFTLSSNVNSTIVVSQAVSALDTYNLVTNGGTVEVGSGLVSALDTVNATIQGGGDFLLSPTAGLTSSAFISLLNAGSVSYGAGGGTLTVGTSGAFGALSETGPIAGFTGASDVIDDQSLNLAGVTGYTVSGPAGGVQTITIADGSGDFSFATSGTSFADGAFAAGSGPLTLKADAAGGTTISAVCFLAGTRLATPGGEAAVEALRVGDLVSVREDGRTVHRPVAWIGSRAVDAARAGSHALPVRIRAHAFAEQVPHRDLLVTQEHCVHVDGRLIPARMLVNGASIVIDDSVTRFEFFHVELDRHAILLSEGLETESYLDTGNRANFAGAAVPALRPDLAMAPGHAAWARAAAPLCVDRQTVEPLWARLAERARGLGLGAAAPAAPAVTRDPDLRLVTEAGLEIRPSLADGRRYAFVVPGGASGLRLVSRAARPSDAVGPFVDDRRLLGVKVGAVGLGVGRRRVAAEAASYGALPGWHGMEPGGDGRWTDGDAALPLDLSACNGAPVMVDVEVLAAGPYLAGRADALAA